MAAGISGKDRVLTSVAGLVLNIHPTTARGRFLPEPETVAANQEDVGVGEVMMVFDIDVFCFHGNDLMAL